jgi:hypothetical protein
MQHSTNHLISWAVVAFALQLVGCMTQNRHNFDVDRTPIANIGAGASIIYPGEGPMPMPGSATRGSSQQTGTTAPGRPSTGDGIVFLGGTRTDESYHQNVREDPLLIKYLMAPVAVVAAPFVLAKEAVMGKPEPGPAIPDRPEPTYYRSNGPATPPRQAVEADDYETAMLRNMEQEIASRRAPDRRTAQQPTVSAAQPSSRAPQNSAPSIEDELQALRRAPESPQTETERAVARPQAHSRVDPPPPHTRSAGEGLGNRRLPATPSSASQNTGNPYPTAHGIVDRNDDGHIDQWIFRENGEIIRQIFDENYDGQPDRTILFDPETHQPRRIEEDTRGDGALDSWVDYHRGVIQRLRADSDGDGVVDTWSFYRAGELVRHEQDTTGDGFRDAISLFSEGLRVREQRDTNGDGQLNTVLHFDDGEQLTRQEDDRDGDGNTDVISHYEGGRLTRREFLQAPELAEGLPSDGSSKAIP